MNNDANKMIKMLNSWILWKVNAAKKSKIKIRISTFALSNNNQTEGDKNIKIENLIGKCANESFLVR